MSVIVWKPRKCTVPGQENDSSLPNEYYRSRKFCIPHPITQLIPAVEQLVKCNILYITSCWRNFCWNMNLSNINGDLFHVQRAPRRRESIKYPPPPICFHKARDCKVKSLQCWSSYYKRCLTTNKNFVLHDQTTLVQSTNFPPDTSEASREPIQILRSVILTIFAVEWLMFSENFSWSTGVSIEKKRCNITIIFILCMNPKSFTVLAHFLAIYMFMTV